MIREIENALNKASASLAKNGIYNTRIWTAAMLGAITKVGNRKGFFTCATRRNAKKASYGSEWVFDACWLKYEGETLRNLTLAAECEWWAAKPIEHENDFSKLVVAKADLRLLICEVQNEKKREELMEWLKWYASGFKPTKGGAYLISCWVIDEQKFTHESFTS